MITTVQQHLLVQQSMHREATGDFSMVMSALTLAAKMVESKIRQGVHGGVMGAFGAVNVQGEEQQKLDVFANNALLHCLGKTTCVAALVSEEDYEPVVIDRDPEQGKYIIIFDPLDGSSNIDVNVSLGTIFSIQKRHPGEDLATAVLKPGSEQIAAGYVVYGPSTALVYTSGNGVHGFTLDPSIGSFVLSHENMRMPAQGPYYSTNEVHEPTWPAGYQQYIQSLRLGELNGKAYNARYIGSLVADFHRTLLKGGIFLYPPTSRSPKGKLRLLYEAMPLAMIAEQAGGAAVSGLERILDIRPTDIHQRTPFCAGSITEVEALQAALRGAQHATQGATA